MAVKFKLKDIAKYACYYLGVSKAVLQLIERRSPRLLVFTYHRVSGPSEGGGYLAVSRDIFEQHVRYIKDNFKTVSMSDGLKALERGCSNEIYASINLDDGYMDNYLNAYPVLKKYGVPATIFLTTDYIGKEEVFWWDRVFNIQKSQFRTNKINSVLIDKDEKEHEPFISEMEKEHGVTNPAGPSKMLSWDEIRDMQNGLISFGSHTKTHRNLCLLSDDEVRRELMDSKSAIEKNIGQKVTEFAYPFGRFDKRVRRLAQEAGFKCARTTCGGINTKNTEMFLLNWIGMGPIPKTSFLSVWIASNLLRHALSSRSSVGTPRNDRTRSSK
ncbi:MAG: polysaccharide deacetylase family protein [Candidatus Gorgyraea atricola]|nr:polysaccharide deacetylase family protein [Candidatus Gorgyraea atricola]